MFDFRDTTTGLAPTVKLNSGYDLPVVGLGTYAFTGRKCVQAVSTALKLGYRQLDTASFYSNEAEVGAGVRASGVPREQVFVATKLYPNQYAHAALAIDDALRKLDLGYIDMMLLHHPAGNDVQAYAAIEKAIAAGKVRCAGISCYYEKELPRFLAQVEIAPDLVQNEMHPFYQDDAVLPVIAQHHLVAQSWYPLGGRGYTHELFSHATIARLAEIYGKSPAQIILRWNLQRGVTVIPGSSNPTHLQQHLELFDFALSAEDIAAMARLERHDKHDWY